MTDSLHPNESPGLLMWRATMRWQRLITATLKPLGLTHVQFVLLTSTWWLTRHGGHIPSQARIAEHAGTDPMMTSQVLRTLEAKGLVVRNQHPEDARALAVETTERGAALALQAVGLVEAADAEFFGADEDGALGATLTRLAGRP